MDIKYKWDTALIFSSDDEWQKAFDSIKPQINFEKYKGRVQNENQIFEYFKEQESVSKKLERLYLYAHMKADENTKISKYFEMLSQIQNLYAKFSESCAFFNPYLTSLPERQLVEYSGSALLKDYDYFFKRLIAQKPHVLSEKEEKLLAAGSEVFSSFRTIFTMIDNADMSFKSISHNGKKIKLTHGAYSLILHGEDAALRKKAFKNYYQSYIDKTNTIAANYLSNVKKDVYISKSRGYKNCLERALKNEDVDGQVYHNLLQSVNENLSYLHEYVALRKIALKLQSLNMYDMYAPVVPSVEMKLEYDHAYDLVIKGLEPLGKDYIDSLKSAKSDRWIDVYESDGKKSGAYCTGIYGIHPFVLLNYKKTTHDIFTIAHEMGHAMHSYYSNAAQAYSKADYCIFVAEVASTVNEVLLIRHILKSTQDMQLKKYLISYFLDMLRTTLFRQTMFAEFEYAVHDRAEKDMPLSKDILNDIYLNLNKKYYGAAVTHNAEIGYEWSRIPHFYNSFYVYKYSTGIISAVLIADKILHGDKNAVNNYKKFLSSGGSAGPVDLLKTAGVDLMQKQAFDSAMQVFRGLVEEFKQMTCGK